MTNSPIKLQAIGYWRTTSRALCDTPDGLPEPNSLRSDKRDFENAIDKVLNYLADGSEFVHWRGLSYCRICGDSSVAMGSRCVTDGIWVWPEGLPHYVNNHGIDLPKEFVAEMAKQDWKPPISTLKPTRDVKSWYDFSFWIRWAREYTGGVTLIETV